MEKPPFQLSPEQFEALRQVQAQWQQQRGRSRLQDSSALAANRNGALTQDQRSLLLSRSRKFGMIGLLLWFALLGAIFAATGRYLENNPVVGFIALFGTLFVVLWIMGLITSMPMRMRLGNPKIQETPGEVVWHGARYVAEANGKLLEGIYDAGMKLPPGLYTFYCLEGTRYLLSAEMTGTHGDTSNAPSGTQTPSQANVDRVELSRALSQSNGFSAADLEANRGGRLSGRQARWLLSDVTSNLWGGAVILIIVVLAVDGFLGKVKPDVNGLLVALAFFAFALVIYLLQIFRDLRDILGARVIYVEGVGTRAVGSSQHGPAHYYYQIAGHRFAVSNAGYEALLEGLPYRVYYVPITGRLVSIEALG